MSAPVVSSPHEIGDVVKDIQSIEDALHLQFSSCPPGVGGRKRTPPQSAYELEQEAELQEIARQFIGLKNNFESRMRDIGESNRIEFERKTKRHLWKSIALAMGAALLLSILVGLVAAKVAYGKTVTQVVADVGRWIGADVAPAPVMLAKAESTVKHPAKPLAPISAPPVNPEKPAPPEQAAGPPTGGIRETPLPKGILDSSSAGIRPEPMPSPTDDARPVAANGHAQNQGSPNSKTTASKVVSTRGNSASEAKSAQKNGDADSESVHEDLFALGGQKPPVQQPAKTTPPPTFNRTAAKPEAQADTVAPKPRPSYSTVVVSPPAKTPPAAPVAAIAPSTESKPAAKPGARRVQYGDGGVVALLPGAVVVFDHSQRKQLMIKIGQEMPDGVLIKSVDPKTGLVSTDRGDVIFE